MASNLVNRLTKKKYQKCRLFGFTSDEVHEILFADNSDDELPDLDEDDIAVLEDGDNGNCSQVLIATEIEPNELGLDLDSEDETTSNGRINSINNQIDVDFTVGDVNNNNSDDTTIQDISVEDVVQSELNFDLKDIDVNRVDKKNRVLHSP